MVLHEKENRKKADRSILFPGGNGRHLTDREVIQQKRQLEMENEREEAEKEGRRVVRESHRAEKERIEEEWKAMLEEHEVAVLEWEANCRSLRERGVRLKDLPKKPK